MTRQGKRWTADEDEYLIAMYGTGLKDVMVGHLGRSAQAINSRASKIRIAGAVGLGRRLKRDEAALASLDGHLVRETAILQKLRVAAGATLTELRLSSGYTINGAVNLRNPTLANCGKNTTVRSRPAILLCFAMAKRKTFASRTSSSSPAAS